MTPQDEQKELWKLEKSSHVRRCGACHAIVFAHLFHGVGNPQYNILDIIGDHIRRDPFPEHPSCTEPFCVHHGRIPHRLADRVARLFQHRDVWTDVKGRRMRRLAFVVTQKDRPDSYEHHECTCVYTADEKKEPCDRAGEIELQHRSGFVNVHLSINVPIDLMDPASAIQIWDKLAPRYLSWCRERWEEWKWLAAEDLRLDPSGRRFAGLGRMKKKKG